MSGIDRSGHQTLASNRCSGHDSVMSALVGVDHRHRAIGHGSAEDRREGQGVAGPPHPERVV